MVAPDFVIVTKSGEESPNSAGQGASRISRDRRGNPSEMESATENTRPMVPIEDWETGKGEKVR